MAVLISCIMPTIPGRDRFRAEAVKCFEAQTWKARELVVIEGPEMVGAKRNIACSRARGEVIAHWDDDDWSAPGRLAEQMRLLEEFGADIVGFNEMEFFDGEQRWLYKGNPAYALGTSLLYPKTTWRARPFAQLQVGEDNEFLRGRKLCAVPAGELMRARIHPGNTSDKLGQLKSSEYRRIA